MLLLLRPADDDDDGCGNNNESSGGGNFIYKYPQGLGSCQSVNNGQDSSIHWRWDHGDQHVHTMGRVNEKARNLQD